MAAKQKLPPFDPSQAPIVQAGVPVAFGEGEAVIPDLRLSSIRARFANASANNYQPERHGDSIRAEHDTPTPSAVLVGIIERDEPTVLLTQRTTRLSDHSGQVAFPGGRKDDTDASLTATALREAYEEVGLAHVHCDVIGHLPDYFTGTGYQVTPVVAFLKPQFSLHLQPDEVAAAFEVPLAFLMNPANHQRRAMEWQGRQRDFYAMPYVAKQWWCPEASQIKQEPREFFIWGATAAMLRNLYRFLL